MRDRTSIRRGLNLHKLRLSQGHRRIRGVSMNVVAVAKLPITAFIASGGSHMKTYEVSIQLLPCKSVKLWATCYPPFRFERNRVTDLCWPPCQITFIMSIYVILLFIQLVEPSVDCDDRIGISRAKDSFWFMLKLFNLVKNFCHSTSFYIPAIDFSMRLVIVHYSSLYRDL